MAPDYPADWHPLSNDAADSSWRGSPMSMFAKGGRVGAKPFEIKVPREHIEKMAKGGLAGQAKEVADAGVGGDTMVIHINKDEYQKLCKEWGEPTINPHTGMPQFTPFWKQSWFAPVAALAGTALMATGVGAGLGSSIFGALGATEAGAAGLGTATGIGALGSVPVSTVAGNALLGAGIGGLTGGVKGALTGGLLSGAGTIGSSALGNYLGSGNAPSWMGGSPPASADISYDKGVAIANTETGAQMLEAPKTGMMSNFTNYLTDPNKMAAAAVGLGALSGGDGPAMAEVPTTPTSTVTDPNMTRRLETTPLNRTRLRPPIDYYNYGKMPEQTFYAPAQQLEQTQPATPLAHGGPLSRAVTGPGTGRSDSIDAKLSDGEYVIDSETVALLGDGSSKAGAAKLDQFRANIRKQKGKALSKGKISPDAESPERYLMGGRA